MNAAPSRSIDLLRDIAATLRVPVEAFTAPQSEASVVPSAQIAEMLFSSDGLRLAASFSALPPQFQRSLADIAEAILASASSKDGA